MNLTRLLADPPATYRVDQITAPGLQACNIVAGQIAGYWITGTEPTQAEWDAIVAAHVPVADPEPEPVDDRSLTVRAEEAARTAYDEVIAAGTLSMSRINQANLAASAARLAILEAG